MAQDLSEPLLDVRDLRIAYSQRAKVLAVRGINFSIARGEAAGVLGESGCGKTSTALAVLNLLPANASAEGTVVFRGANLLNAPEKDVQKIRGAQISFVPQEPLLSLSPVLRAVDQVAHVVRAHSRVSWRECRDRASAALRRVGLDGERLQRSYPHELSGGQRQRVLIAQAIVCQPALLIADEPTGSLDPEAEREILALLGNLVEQLGISLFLISHAPHVLQAIAARVLVMYAGRIVEAGPAGDVFQSPMHPYTRGLLACLGGSRGSRAERLEIIPGSPPDLSQLPPGCSFQPRCREQVSCCSKLEPPVLQHGERQVSCFLYEQAG